MNEEMSVAIILNLYRRLRYFDPQGRNSLQRAVKEVSFFNLNSHLTYE